MTKREEAISNAARKMYGQGYGHWREVLSDLIDRAERGEFREPVPVHCVGMSEAERQVKTQEGA